MTATITIARRPVSTDPCNICGVPVPADAGRTLCLGCLDGRPGSVRPTPGGRPARMRYRELQLPLSTLGWRVLDAIGADTVDPEQLAARLDVPVAQIGRTAHRAGVIRRGLLLAVSTGYRLSAEGLVAFRTRQPPVRRRPEWEFLDAGRERAARHRARRKGGES